MAKVYTTLRTHWKKSIFFSGAAIYGADFAKRKYHENELMRVYSRKAAQFGSQTVPLAGTRPYHVTVILNPAANGGKAKKKFEQYCAPLLHLAGLKVSVIRTEGQGQAKEIMKIMEDTDAVLVAGGDGTLMETVTGFLRRADSKSLSRTLPIGILPIGVNNMMAKHLYPDVQVQGSDVALMAECAMSVIKQLFRPVDVMEIKTIEDPDLKPLYGLRQLKLGAFAEAHDRRDKYWYWAGLKKYMTYVFGFTTSASKLTWDVCSWVQTGRNNIIETEKPPPPKKSFWSLWPSPPPESEDVPEIETTWSDKFDYSECCELEIASRNNFPLSKDNNSSNKMTLSVGPNELSFRDNS